MDEADFRRKVQPAGRHEPAQALAEALDYFCKDVRRFTLENISLCVQLAGRFAARSAPTAATASVPQMPATAALNAHSLQQISPRIQRIRRGLTGSTRPPCTSMDDAVEWCRRVEPAWLLTDRYAESEQRYLEYIHEAQQDIRTRLERARQAYMAQPPRATLPGHQWAWQHPLLQDTPRKEVSTVDIERARQLLGPCTVRHILADMLACVHSHIDSAAGQTALAQYIQDTPQYHPRLPRLARATRELAHLTGCAQVDLAAHVLADAPLHRPAYRMSGHSILSGGKRHRRVDIALYAPMTHAEDRAFQRQIRHAFGSQKMKALTQDDQEFLTIVDAAIQAHNGQLPRGRRSGAKEFWEGVAQQWNTRRGQRVYTDWTGPKQRYVRLQARSGVLLGP